MTSPRVLRLCRGGSVLLLGILPLLVGCRSATESEADGPRLVLLYAPCTVNLNYLSPYNPEVEYTPNLQAFSESAAVFMRHQTESGQSGIAIASILSGRQADEHSVFAHPARIPDSVPLITEAFRDAGYEVFAWLFHGMASSELNYTQGVAPENDFKTLLTGQDPRFVQLLDHLVANPSAKAFVVATFTVTHQPYPAPLLPKFCQLFPNECGARKDPEEFRRYEAIYMDNQLMGYDFERAVARLGLGDDEISKLADVIELRYKAGIFKLDRLFGQLLAQIEARDLLPKSAVVFTADHGEVLFRENAFFLWGHGYQQAPEVLNVPLIVRAPEVASGTYESVTRSIDVFPTLAGLAQLPPSAYEGPGADLSVGLRGKRALPVLSGFSHSSLLSHPAALLANQTQLEHFKSLFPRRDPDLMWVSLREGDRFYKLRRLGGSEHERFVFDLATDPTESLNLYDVDSDVQRSLFLRLEKYRSNLITAHARWRKARAAAPLAPGREEELLRSLGYIE